MPEAEQGRENSKQLQCGGQTFSRENISWLITAMRKGDRSCTKAVTKSNKENKTKNSERSRIWIGKINRKKN